MAHETIISELKLPKLIKPYSEVLNTEILPTDAMYQFDKNAHHYFSCGASALTCVLHALGFAGIENPSHILDFGCGAGRVTRWLRAAFPESVIHACDLREQDLEFVGKSCNARTWVSGIDIDDLEAFTTYDAIWVGSVFTHLSAEKSIKLLDKLVEWLNPHGVLIFSVHGRFVLHRANTGDNIYGLGKNWEQLIKSYEDTGYGYADYLTHEGYGISLSKSVWWINLIENCSDRRLVCLTERSWDRHHDVIAIQKENWD